MNDTRIILFTGKGGVGKTTISAATAIRAAQLGYKTLVMSTDPAHSLADALDHPLGPEPTQIQECLFGQEFDVYYSIKKYLNNMRELMLTLFRKRGVDKILAEEMAVLPGMEETAVFLWLEMFYRSGQYDLIIIDSAPTGETLKHLTFPQVSQWWLTRAVPVQKLGKSIGPTVRRFTGVPLDKGLAELEVFYDKLNYIHEVMSNPDICTIRLVMNPERMVIQEALRGYTYLQLYGYPVDAVVINRILPENSSQEVFGDYLASQKQYLAEINDTFAPLPIFRAPHLGREVFGPERLQDFAERMYDQKDPRDIFFKRKPYHFIEQKYGYLLTIHLPFVKDEDVSVAQNGDELIIQAANRRRNLFLPKFLAYYKVTNSQVMDNQLLVRFEKSYGVA